MYIKQLTIQGFKSYSDKTVVGPFHPGHNVVVGRNGSGKSNFFSAVEFVLSGEFTNLRQEQRCALLHEGTGDKPVNAYVEIMFDNTDRRLPVDSDEVSVKRNIGAKKDQFFINSRLATSKNEVTSLLESAGLSMSNPYYIVKQGQINNVACCSERDRLKVVRQVAGTEIYDDRKNKSEEELVTTNNVINQIQEGLDNVSSKLDQLEEEKVQLEEFKVLDSERRGLELSLIEGEMEESMRKLENVDKDLGSITEETNSVRQEYDERKNNLVEMKSKVTTFGKQIDNIVDEKREHEQQVDKLSSVATGLELKLNDARESLENKDNDDIIDKADEEVGIKETDLKKLYEELNESRSKVQIEAEKLAMMEQGRNLTFAKIGRKEQFRNKEQRNEWICQEVEKIKSQIESKQLQIQELSKTLDNSENELSNAENNMKTIFEDGKELDILQKNSGDELRSLVLLKGELVRQQTECGTNINQLRHSLDQLNEEIRLQNIKLRTIGGLRPFLVGIDSINEVLNRCPEMDDGYHGLVVENINCPDVLYTAMDEIAGSRLFNHLVGTDKDATNMLKEINKRKLPGVFNFMPLNRIMNKIQNYSKINTDEAFPMITKIEYDNDIEMIVSFLFGRTLICRNMDTVVKLARSSGFDCITLDGEKGSCKGVLSGGYVNREMSKMANYKKLQVIKDKITVTSGEMEQIKSEVDQLENSLAKTLKDVEVKKYFVGKNENNQAQQAVESQLLGKVIHDIQDKLSQDRQKMSSMQTELALLQSNFDGLKKEEQEEMSSQLNSQEQKACDEKVKNIEEIKSKFKEATKLTNDIEQKVNKIEVKIPELKSNIDEVKKNKRKQAKIELDITVMTVEWEQEESRLENKMNTLRTMKEKEKELRAKIKNLSKDCEVEETTIKGLKEAASEEIMRKDKLYEKKSGLNSLLNKLAEKKDNVGAVPSNYLEKYANKSRKVLAQQLEKTNRKLKKFDNVNKKALEQYVTFTEENERLSARFTELTEDKERILNMINVLDARKSEQILYTYKQIFKYFKEVFGQMVPSGRGELLLTGSSPDQSLADRLDSSTGLTVSVSFTGDSSTMKNLDQLSGGQKTVVALTFILAIQRCDPAPFYLLDEVDAALDIDHRRSISSVIHSQTHTAQFITTTFRPELLEQADQFFGVLFRGRASHVKVVGKEEAKGFVEDDQINK